MHLYCLRDEPHVFLEKASGLFELWIMDCFHLSAIQPCLNPSSQSLLESSLESGYLRPPISRFLVSPFGYKGKKWRGRE